MNHKTQWTKLVVGTLAMSALTLAGCSSAKRQQERKIASDLVVGNDNQIAEIEAPAVKADDTENVAAAKNWVIDTDPKEGFVTGLADFDRLHLQKGKPAVQPWGGSYWPDRVGGIAGRYHDMVTTLKLLKGNPTKTLDKFERWNGNLQGKRFSSLTKDDVAYLSAAEKYDILMGDEEFTLTHEVYRGIREQYDRVNAVAPAKLVSWSGICNGWSPAAILLPRPRHTITAKSPSGVDVTFFPDDLKALGSLLFAHSFITTTTTYFDGKYPDVAMYGLRCDTKKPRRRAGVVEYLEEGQYTASSNECTDDVNPGAWHLAILNRMGVQKKSFVIDSNYDQSVDNHPVIDYEYVYYNPKSGKTGTSEGSLMKLSDYRDDPFKDRRRKESVYVVGIKMEVKFLAGNHPYYNGLIADLIENPLRTTDDESNDKWKVMQLRYDLELDANKQVVGGQWRINKKQKTGPVNELIHPSRYPDFMWYFRPRVEDVTDNGQKYDANQKMDGSWVDDSRKAAKNRSLYFSLDDRSGDPRLKDQKLRLEAKAASKEYDVQCRKHCAGAYAATPVPEDLAVMKPLDDKLNALHKKLDELGVPRDYPYSQPLSRVVYGLFEKAK